MSDEVAEQDVSEDVVDAAPESDVEDSSSPESAPEQAAPGPVWDAFKTLPQFQGQDDRAIAMRLYEALQREQSATHALQQYQSIVPVTSEYLSNREMYEQWKASKNQPQQAAPQQQAQPAKEEPASWWNPPKIRDAYRQYLVRDENGREMISENAPLDARHALTEFQAYKADFARKFLENPEQALGSMVEKVAGQRAESIVQQQIGRMKEESFVADLERENKDWLYDQQGNVSREGVAAQKYIEDAKALGIGGAKARWEYATMRVERDLLLANLQAMQQAQPVMQAPAAPAPVSPSGDAAQRNMEFLRQQAMRTAPRNSPATTNPRVPQKPLTFAQRLQMQLQEEGIETN